jgi:hypothetical protein
LDELIGITMGEGAVSIAIYTASYWNNWKVYLYE